MLNKAALKDMLGDLPLTAEIYWLLRQGGQPIDAHFDLKKLVTNLPAWRQQAAEAATRTSAGGSGFGKQVFIFSTLRYWIEHTCLVGLALAGQGHQVTLGFLPYDNWKKPLNRFDLRRQNAYAKQVLQAANPTLTTFSLLDVRRGGRALPPDLLAEVKAGALRDTQYSLQVEEVDLEGDLYKMRLERDTQAAQAAYSWMDAQRPDVVLIPNGTILEFSAVYATARHLGLDVVTYEFGEQNRRIWLAKNDLVMKQATNDLWEARKAQPLTEQEWVQVRTLFSRRQGGELWGNFSRRWQGTPSAGGENTRKALGLDDRPVLLIPTNVIGDSLTLGRQTFTGSMTEWILRTVRYLAGRPDVQVVIRAHPGERLKKGPPVIDLIRQSQPDLPAHIRCLPADSAVNTYDLIETADLGMVYTTTVGLEMAMSGVPAIVIGQTHYRAKGFTNDPSSWEAYFDLLDRALSNPESLRLSRDQVELAWRYAYSFFFEYPRPFPWHLIHYWRELPDWPISRVLSEEGQGKYAETFRLLIGDSVDWRLILKDSAP